MFEEVSEISNPSILASSGEGVLLIELNRPDKHNAVDQSVVDGLTQAFEHLDAEDNLAAAVLTGRGGTFCSGMDLKAYVESGPPQSPRGAFGMGERPPVKPVVAAVERWALAGGFELALCCDLIVAGESARFGLPEVKHGLIAAGGGAIRLPRSIGYHAAAEVLLTGEPVSAARLHTLGIVNRIVSDGSATEEAMALAKTIAANNYAAVQASKVVSMRACGWTDRTTWHIQEPEATLALQSETARQGASAFISRKERD